MVNNYPVTFSHNKKTRLRARALQRVLGLDLAREAEVADPDLAPGVLFRFAQRYCDYLLLCYLLFTIVLTPFAIVKKHALLGDEEVGGLEVAVNDVGVVQVVHAAQRLRRGYLVWEIIT